MWRWILLCAVLTAIVANSGASAGQDRWVIAFNGVGNVKIGMSLSELNTALHERFTMPTEKGDQGCFYVNSAKHPHISFMIEDGRMVRVDVDSAGIPTTQGVQVGDSEEQALQVYGPKLKVSESQYDPEGHYLTIQSERGRNGIRFETEKGKIKTYYAGRFEAVQYVEGCQ
jgi:hypothetical protein